MPTTDKVTAVALAGAVTTIVFWLIQVATELEPPAAVVAACTTILTVLAGYLKRETNPVVQ